MGQFCKICTYCVCAILFSAQAEQITVMLSPAGDTTHTGRTLADGFERTAARDLAEKIKAEIELREPDISIVITHETGQTADQKSRANFANRLNVDLYISIGCFSSDRLIIDTFYRSTNTLQTSGDNNLSFCPASQAHLKHAQKTLKFIKKGLIPGNLRSRFIYHEPLGLPLQTLTGTNAPACAIELGIGKISDALIFAPALAQGILEALHEF